MFLRLTSLVFPALIPCAIAGLVNVLPLGVLSPSYSSSFMLRENIVGDDFFSRFEWQTFDDPTHGRVDYVDQATASERNLTFATSKAFIMRADYTNIVSQTARGRCSNRIKSHATYTDSILVLDVQHVPWGCATWPAFWTVAPNNWPNGGEIDIIEGANKDRANHATLHTTPGCEMDQNRQQTGTTTSTNCDAYSNGNEGCSTTLTKPGSYGEDLNRMGGGWYVMKRTQSDGVFVWFFARNDPSVPVEVKNGLNKVNPDDTWGTPDARFPSTDKCDFDKHFNAHEIVFDTTFCGDWAGHTFSSDCGPSSCAEYVNNNPEAFQDAYWEINALRVYTPDGPSLP